MTMANMIDPAGSLIACLIDINPRKQNRYVPLSAHRMLDPAAARAAIESHPLQDRITLIEGDSTAPEVVAKVKAEVGEGESVFVLLDSDHTYPHVKDELEAYAPLISPDSDIVAADGVMRDLHDVPGGDASWKTDNPATAAEDFAARHPEFALETPPRHSTRAPPPSITPASPAPGSAAADPRSDHVLGPSASAPATRLGLVPVTFVPLLAIRSHKPARGRAPVRGLARGRGGAQPGQRRGAQQHLAPVEHFPIIRFTHIDLP